MVVFLLSWYHWSNATWLRKLQGKYNRITNTLQRSASRVLLTPKSSSSLQDDDDLSFLEDEKSNGSNASDDIDDISGTVSKEKHATLKHRKSEKSSF